MITDTSKLQSASVKHFMEGLGYEYLGVDRVFHSSLWVNRARMYISYNTAITLHNEYKRMSRSDVLEPFDFPEGMIQAAKDSKLVVICKQQNSKRKGIVTQDHMVKFCDQDMASLFIKEE